MVWQISGLNRNETLGRSYQIEVGLTNASMIGFFVTGMYGYGEKMFINENNLGCTSEVEGVIPDCRSDSTDDLRQDDDGLTNTFITVYNFFFTCPVE